MFDTWMMAGARPATLTERLRAFGIEPIPKNEAEAHKRIEAAKHSGNLAGRIFATIGLSGPRSYSAIHICLNLIRIIVPPILCFGGLACIGFSSVATVLGVSDASIGFVPMLALAGVFALGGGMFATGMLVFVAFGNGFGTARSICSPARWKRSAFRLGEYRRPLPDSVPGIVCRSLLLPGLRLEIDELWQNQVVVDPILWVVDPATGEEEAVAIWGSEEPERGWFSMVF